MKKITFLISFFLITSVSLAQEYILNTSSSELKWTGTELTTKIHYGSIDFKSGNITLSEGQPVGGKFIVDMTTLKNEDLPEAYRGRLEGHLKSDDFFSVVKFPFTSKLPELNLSDPVISKIASENLSTEKKSSDFK